MSEPSPLTIPVTVRRDFALPPSALYKAWLDPQVVGQWLFHVPGGVRQKVEVEPNIGGRFVIAEQRGDSLAEHCGTYEELVSPTTIVFRFTADGGQTQARVLVQISPYAQGSQMTVTHELPHEWAHFGEQACGAWTKMLDNLATTLGTQ